MAGPSVQFSPFGSSNPYRSQASTPQRSVYAAPVRTATPRDTSFDAPRPRTSDVGIGHTPYAAPRSHAEPTAHGEHEDWMKVWGEHADTLAHTAEAMEQGAEALLKDPKTGWALAEKLEDDAKLLGKWGKGLEGVSVGLKLTAAARSEDPFKEGVEAICGTVAGHVAGGAAVAGLAIISAPEGEAPAAVLAVPTYLAASTAGTAGGEAFCGGVVDAGRWAWDKLWGGETADRGQDTFEFVRPEGSSSSSSSASPLDDVMREMGVDPSAPSNSTFDDVERQLDAMEESRRNNAGGGWSDFNDAGNANSGLEEF